MKKYKMLFDANIIESGISKNSNRSGIFFVAINILKEFFASGKFNIKLYCDLNNREAIDRVIEEFCPNAKYSYFQKSKIEEMFEKYEEKHKKADNQKKFLKKIFYKSIIILLKQLLKIIKKQNYSYYFSPVFKVPQGIEEDSSIKKFVILYDLMPILFPEYYYWNNDESWHSQLLFQLNSNDTYFAISEHTKQDFIKYCPEINPDKVVTTLLACDDKFKPQSVENIERAKEKYNIPLGKKYIFSLCTLEPRKNLIRAVKTFTQFVKKNNIDDLVFVLGGGHWDSFIDKLKEELGSLKGFEDKIIRAGYIDDEDLAPLYSGAEWFVYTSQYEGFGLPPLEAMSCACPVITSNNSSMPEVVGDSGIMIDWDSDEQHIMAYEKYYFNSDLRKENANKGLERAKQFSWGKCADIMINTMEKI